MMMLQEAEGALRKRGERLTRRGQVEIYRKKILVQWIESMRSTARREEQRSRMVVVWRKVVVLGREQGGRRRMEEEEVLQREAMEGLRSRTVE